MIQNILIVVIIIAWSLVIFLPEYIQNKKLKAFNSKIIRLTSEPVLDYRTTNRLDELFVTVYFKEIRIIVIWNKKIDFEREESYEYKLTFINGSEVESEDLNEETKAHLRNFLNLPKK